MLRTLKGWLSRSDKDRQTREWLSRASVVFACSPKEAAEIDIAVGPCVWRIGPRGGRVRPVVPPSSQLYSTPLSQIALLYTLMTDRPSEEAFRDHRRSGQAVLARPSQGFEDELAALGGTGEERGDAVEALEDARNRLAERWFRATTWSPTMTLGGVEGRLWLIVYGAVQGRRKGLDVYAWEGPAIAEYAITRR